MRRANLAVWHGCSRFFGSGSLEDVRTGEKEEKEKRGSSRAGGDLLFHQRRSAPPPERRRRRGHTPLNCCIFLTTDCYISTSPSGFKELGSETANLEFGSSFYRLDTPWKRRVETCPNSAVPLRPVQVSRKTFRGPHLRIAWNQNAGCCLLVHPEQSGRAHPQASASRPTPATREPTPATRLFAEVVAAEVSLCGGQQGCI